MKYLIKGFVLAAIVVIGTATVSSVEAISLNHVICSILICGNKKEQLVKSCSFLYCYQFLEEEVVNFMDEMLTEEGDTTMHNDEDQEVFECAVHDNACFDFMF